MNSLGRYIPANFSANTPISIDAGLPWEYIRIINNSPYLLSVSFGNQGTFDFPEMYLEDIAVGQDFQGKIVIVPIANFSAAAISNALSSLISITAYNPGELASPQSQPITTMAAVGGGALSTVQSIVNFGQPQPTRVLTTSPQSSLAAGFGNTAAVIENDGTTSLGGNPDPAHDTGQYVLTDNAGNLTAASIAPNTKLPAGFTFLKSNKAVTLLAGNQETGYVALANNNGTNAGNPNIVGVNPKTLWLSTPSSITFTADATTNINAPFASDLTQNGFGFAATQPAAGFTRWLGTYTTVGL